ncbi:putative ribonuclease H-like domain-containing protein, partial [Tanacetum coccineum]
MTGNKSFLIDNQEVDGGFVAFAGSPKGGKITRKGKIRTGKLDFEDVYFVKELKFNLFSVSQMCDKKNSVLFTKTECLVLSPDFKLLDESQVLLKVLTQNNMYSFDLKNVVPSGGLTCLFAKATIDESNLWHRRLGHINFKTMKKLVRGNLVRGLPSKLFENDHTCVACQKESQSQSFLSSKDAIADDAGKKTNEESANEGERNGQVKEGGASNKEDYQNVQDFRAALDNLLVQQKKGYTNSTNKDSTASPSVSAVGQCFTNADDLPTDPLKHNLEDTGIFSDLLNKVSSFSGARLLNEDVGIEADLNNLETTTNISEEHAMVSYIKKQRRTNHKDYKNCLFAYFLSQIEPKKVTQALTDPRWIEAMQDELLQFRLQKVWRLVDLPKGKHAIGTKWVYRNMKDERGIVVRNKARLDAQEEVYVCQPPEFEDLQFPDKVYKVEKALYGLHQAPRAWYETLSTYLLEIGFRKGIIDKTLFIKKDKGDILLVQVYVDDIIFGSTKKSLCVKQKDNGIFISLDKYVADIMKKFDFVTMKRANTPIKTNKALFKDKEAKDVDVHLYRSMNGSLMYLTTSRPDIMFAVCACARFQVTPKVLHLHAMKRIFRYLKGQPKLGLWYPRDSPFDLEAFNDSDYAGASLDRKSTIGGCQFLSKRLISWQCKKQTLVAHSTTKVEYVADANCCRQVLWIQNQMLDYGFMFMNTKIYIDNESTICIVKNPVFHSKPKHIEIRHHFIRDSNEKKLIQMIKIHINHNVVDLLTKAFDVSRMEMAATTASSLEVEQDSGNINRTQFIATFNEFIPEGIDSGSGPRLNLLRPVLVYAARNSLTIVRHKLMLLVQVNVVEALTKSGQVPVNVAKQRAAVSISIACPVNTVAPKSKVNDALPKTYSYFKAHSPVRRAFNKKSAAKTNNLNEIVKTARVNNVTTAMPKAVVSAAIGNGENVVKSSACWIWRPTGNVIDHTSKDSGSYMFKRFDYVDLQGRLKHMTGNKSFLTDYQEVNGGFVAFAGSPKGGKITEK